MTKISCELVLASKNEMTGDIIYTFKQTYPRIILAEVNTHLIAAKNSASSRAIPTLTQLKNILKDPFIPVSIGQYQKGMQAGKEITGWKRKVNEFLWSTLRYVAVFVAWLTYVLGAPKQFSNRLVEPWMWVQTLWTSTDIENELLQRDHPMAEPHYEILAGLKRKLIEDIKVQFSKQGYYPYLLGKTQVLKVGQCHLPYLNKEEFITQLNYLKSQGDIRWTNSGILKVWNEGTSNWFYIEGLKDDLDIAKSVSAARCAWVSYYMPGDTSKKMNNVLQALNTYHKLAGSNPKHLSPLMHVATPLPLSVRVGSHCGWFMFRKELKNESGGDKIVPSITPQMAKDLLSDYKEGKTSVEIRHRLAESFIASISTQLDSVYGKEELIA